MTKIVSRGPALRWLRRNAQRSEQWCQNGEGASRRVPDTSVRGLRSYHAETKSKPACLHRRGAREKSGILNITTPIFFNSSARTGLTEQTFGEKSWGHRPFWDFIFKKPLFPIAIHTKTGMLFGQHFDGESPRNLNHVFLRQFGNGFNKKIGMFMFKNQNDGATLSATSSSLPTIKASKKSALERVKTFGVGEQCPCNGTISQQVEKHSRPQAVTRTLPT